MGEKIVALSLPPRAELDGSNFAHIFYGKTVHFRPHKALLPNFNCVSASSAVNDIASLSSSDDKVIKRLNNAVDVLIIPDF